MLSRQYRFHGRNSVRAVYGRGQTVRGQGLSLRFATNPRRKEFRAAVVVSRKVSKAAVVRNRLRRRLYEQIRLLAPNFNGAYDQVWTVFDTQLLTLSHDELRRQVVELLTKAAILPAPEQQGRAIVKSKES